MKRRASRETSLERLPQTAMDSGFVQDAEEATENLHKKTIAKAESLCYNRYHR
jgi:hypothetical protein